MGSKATHHIPGTHLEALPEFNPIKPIIGAVKAVGDAAIAISGVGTHPRIPAPDPAPAPKRTRRRARPGKPMP